LPPTVLGQIPVQVSQPMAAAIQAVPHSPAFKVGLQFKRRREQDETTAASATPTRRRSQIGYLSFGDAGKWVLAGYRSACMPASSLPAKERLAKAIGTSIHPHKAGYEAASGCGTRAVNLGCSA
jgi:monoamine oxidase